MKLKKTLAGTAVAFSLALTAWLPSGTVNPTAAVGIYIHDSYGSYDTYDIYEIYGLYDFYGFEPIPQSSWVCPLFPPYQVCSPF